MNAIRWCLVSWLLTTTWIPANGFLPIKIHIPWSSFGIKPSKSEPTTTKAQVRNVENPAHFLGQLALSHVKQFLDQNEARPDIQPPTTKTTSIATTTTTTPITTTTSTTTTPRPKMRTMFNRRPVYPAAGRGRPQNGLMAGRYPVMQPLFGHRPTTYFPYPSPMGLMMPYPGYRPLFGLEGLRQKVVNRIVNNNMNINTGTQGAVGRREQSHSIGSQADRTATDRGIAGIRNITESTSKGDISPKNSGESVRPNINGGVDGKSSGEPGAGIGIVGSKEGSTHLTEQEKEDRYNHLLKEYKKFLEQSGKNDILIRGMQEGQTDETYFETERKVIEKTFYRNFTSTNMSRTFTQEKMDVEQ